MRKCPYCLAKATLRCSKCKSIWYCGAKCQLVDWTKHKPICNLAQQKHIMVQDMLDFAVKTIVGAERAFYRSQNLGLQLKSDAMQNIALQGLIYYLNLAHRALCLHDDDYLEQAFKRLQRLGHSQICLLNIVMLILKTMQLGLDRQKLDLSTLEAYSASVERQILAQGELMRSALEANLNHNCQGQELEPYDADKPFFFASH